MGSTRKRAKKEQEQRYDIGTIHGSFTGNLESLDVFVSTVAPVAKEHDRALMERLGTVAEKIGEIVAQVESRVEQRGQQESKVRLTAAETRQIREVLKDLRILSPLQVELLHRSSFVMLVSYFDFLLSDLIHYYYQRYPESLSGKELSIKLSELRFCADLAEAIDYVVNKEVENVLYDNLDDQKNYFRNTLKIDIKEDIINWNRINEAIERRNIIVHNNSKINRRYLKNVDLSVLSVKTKDLKEGAEITINEEYFATVYHETLLAGVMLIQCCWRKWAKDDIDRADIQLIHDMYTALVKEKWAVAEQLGSFSRECKPFSEKNRLHLDINYCQSLKWQNKNTELAEELKKFDMSSLSPMYILALSALKSDRDSFYKNVENAIIVDKIDESAFSEWPLFRELREDSEYEERIKAAFTAVSRTQHD